MFILLNFLRADFLTELIGNISEFLLELELSQSDVLEFVLFDAALMIVGACLILELLGLLLEGVEVLNGLVVHGVAEG